MKKTMLYLNYKGTRWFVRGIVGVLVVLSFATLQITSAQTISLNNPLGPTSDIPTIIGMALRGLFGVIGTIALIIFIYGGFLWMTAFGEEQKVKKGWDTMMWAGLGLVVMFGSYVAVEFILKAILGS